MLVYLSCVWIACHIGFDLHASEIDWQLSHIFPGKNMCLCGREIFMLGLVCMLNEEWKQMSLWKLELGIDVKICKILVFWLIKNSFIHFMNRYVRSFTYHILEVRISSVCKQNCHNFYKTVTCCHVKRSQATLKENGKCNTATLHNLICLSSFPTVTITTTTTTTTTTKQQ